MVDPVVQEIRRHRLIRGKTQLLVHYAGTADHEDTWLESNYVKNRTLVDDYMADVATRAGNNKTAKETHAAYASAQARTRIREQREKEEHDKAIRTRILAGKRYAPPKETYAPPRAHRFLPAPSDASLLLNPTISWLGFLHYADVRSVN